MEAGSKKVANDQAFCWEQILKNNRTFRLSYIFAPGDSREKLLPLYALFSSIEQICAAASDEQVAYSKLNWWRNECIASPMVESDHPIVRELVRSGVAATVSDRVLAQFFDTAEARLEASATANMEELKIYCQNIHRPQLDLELNLTGENGPATVDPAQSARSGLLQLIRESVERKGQGGYWWLPLRLLARHGISRDDILGGVNSAPGTSLMREVISTANNWGQLEGKREQKGKRMQSARHILVISELNSRKLKRLEKTAPDAYPHALKKLNLGDLFTAWTTARQL